MGYGDRKRGGKRSNISVALKKLFERPMLDILLQELRKKGEKKKKRSTPGSRGAARKRG